jgi:hypothetical protein
MITEQEARRKLMAVLRAEKNRLTPNGFGGIGYVFDFNLRSFAQAYERCSEARRLWRTRTDSATLSRRVGVSEGTFIAAAIAAGFTYTREDGRVLFNMRAFPEAEPIPFKRATNNPPRR